MKISLNWISDFVDLSGVDYQQLIDRFTLATAEVEDVYKVGDKIEGVIVEKIVDLKNHPKSDHLHLLKVDTGTGIVDCVCGAKNVKLGMLVAFAPVGAKVIEGEMKEATILGEKSFGMCCSKEELGLEEKSDGIWEILDNLPLGTDIKKAYPIEDTIFEIDNKSLTNRPDLWGYYGIAREIAVLLGRPLNKLVVDDLSYFSQMSSVPVEVMTQNCYRYCCIKIGNVTKKISPESVQIRLYYSGMRAINLLADLTNYIMLELGQPMHAFDGNAIQKVVVRDVKSPITFQTLDKQNRLLPEDTMIICNDETPVCIAGVMGGLDSEITDDSDSVLLEGANFDSASVRKTAAKLGLRSEASARYEKSLDPELTIVALGRYLHILRLIDPNARVVSGLTDVYHRHYPKRVISTTMEFINHYVGVALSTQFVLDTLTSLGFSVKNDGYNLQIEVPSYRATKDITLPVDIVEEVARIYGYNNIVPEPVKETINPVEQKRDHLLEYDVKQMLAEKFGLNETHSYIWQDEASLKELNIQTTGYIKILNSTVKDNDQIRSELMPTILKVINDNKNQIEDFGTFEIGRVVTGLDENKLAVEKKHLAVGFYSTKKTEKELYLKAKQVIETLVGQFLNKKVEYKLSQVAKNYVHPINNASLFVDGKHIGYVALLHPLTKNAIDKKCAVAILEIDFSLFAEILPQEINIEMPSKYQVTSLDFNFVMSSNAIYADVLENLNRVATNLKYTVSLKDIYVDNENLAGKKSLTFGVKLWSDDHTLTSVEIENFHSSFIQNASIFGYELRD